MRNLQVLCGPCKGKGKTGNIVCAICKGRGYLRLSELKQRALAEAEGR